MRRRPLSPQSRHAVQAALRTLLAPLALMTVLVGVSACGTPQQGSDPSDVPTEEQEADTRAGYDEALEGTGIVSTFIDEPFFDGTIASVEDATEAVMSARDRIGGDDTTDFECVTAQGTEAGTTYYTFQQQVGDITVKGASVKLVVDKQGKAVGLVSSILPDVKVERMKEWATSAEQAEEVVRKEFEQADVSGVQVVEGASEQTLIAVKSGSEVRRYAWIVYTNNYYDDVDMAYVAHYVSEDGEYLYNIPVGEPGDVDALMGESAQRTFDFSKYEQGEWTGEVTLHDGSTKQLTVPVLQDPETGELVLGDAERKVLCADFTAFAFDDKLVPIASSADEAEYQSIDLLVYDTYLRIWDFYASVGWPGPDGEKTPSLLLMNLVDNEGDPVMNAMYSGRYAGWHTFGFTRLASYGECTDVMAHEFTHCVTSTTMTSNLYKNDMGAINEGMSDVMGNLVEMLLGDSPEGAWIYGEGGGDLTLGRSLKDPHEFLQPEYAWDSYYEPSVVVGNAFNDQGGVHTNSSLLNTVSYKLNQAGMDPSDQFFFWMNVALAMTPSADYPLMVELLPWCMEQSGYRAYVEPLKEAIADAKFTVTEDPHELPPGTGAITMESPDQEVSDAGDFVLFLYPEDAKTDIRTWPPVGTTRARSVVPAGSYKAKIYLCVDDEETMYVLDGDSWERVKELDGKTGEPLNGMRVRVEEGQTVELPAF